MSWLSAKGCLCRQPDGWAVGKADGVCHRYPRTRFADWGSLPTGWLSAKRLLCRPQSIGSRQSRLCRLPLVAVGKEGLCRQGYSILSAKPRAVGKAPFSCSVYIHCWCIVEMDWKWLSLQPPGHLCTAFFFCSVQKPWYSVLKRGIKELM